MPKFIKVKVFTWDTFFNGGKNIQVKDDVTIADVKAWIEHNMSMGGGGNYVINSIKVDYLKLNVNKIKYMDVPTLNKE